MRAIIKAENRRILFQWPIKTKKQGAGVFMGKKSWERLCEEREFNAFYQALAQQSGFEQIGRFLQHGSTTRLMHSVAVAYYSYRLAKITRLSFHWEEMVRGALLHDYFLYDAQDGDPAHKWHWTRHPGIAAENAKREMPLTAIEEDTIRCHMFPLTVKPPKYREGVVVSLVDKACSVYEFFSRRTPYVKLQENVAGVSSVAGPQIIVLLPEMAGKRL